MSTYTDDRVQIWWVLDPRQSQHCEDCQRLASRSPYRAPGRDVNALQQTPTDGGTRCGVACTCRLSYGPPHTMHWDRIDALSAAEQRMLTLNHRQRRWVDEVGLTWTNRRDWREVKAVTFTTGAFQMVADNQVFEMDQVTKMLVLWQTSLAPRSTGQPQALTTLRPDGDARRIGDWHHRQVMWVFSKRALAEYTAAGWMVPERADEEE